MALHGHRRGPSKPSRPKKLGKAPPAARGGRATGAGRGKLRGRAISGKKPKPGKKIPRDLSPRR